MASYKAPLTDVRFLLNEVFDYPSHYQSLSNGGEATPDMVDAILGECARFCENTLFPLYQSGDQEGCQLVDGEVKTPAGYQEAYEEYVAGGWQGLSSLEEYGGQNLPASLGLMKQEMMGTANWPFSMYPGLSMGAMNTLQLHGDEDQRQTYLTPMTEGRWTGTMCLTEPQCGTDLGQVRTKAVPQDDGSYRVTGTKIFISSGDHDMAENIVHIVLARTPEAPKGTKGISLFIVPKYRPDEQGKVGAANGVSVGALEEKMGIKASATCTMNFDDAVGYMIGEENKGLECMFTFMNTARIGTAIQGVGPAELSYQNALSYAKERRSMRALSGKKEPDQVADSLMYHADVRRMLLTQKAVAEGGRAMLYDAAQFADHMVCGTIEEDQKKADEYDDKLGFLTPILKGFLTELGYEATNLGMQVFGGHGYIKEHGMEQMVRDTRIATLYEGTTGIQALDLLGRKTLLMTQGGAVRDFTLRMSNFARKHLGDKAVRHYCWRLLKLAAQWNWLTLRLMVMARKDRDMVSSAANDFLMYSGYVYMAFMWARMAVAAQQGLRQGGGQSEDFYHAKLATAELYFERMLPRAQGHAESMLSPSETLMKLDNDHFAFDY